MNMPRHTKEEEKKIIALYLGRYPNYNICELWNISNSGLFAILKRNKIKTNRKRKG